LGSAKAPDDGISGDVVLTEIVAPIAEEGEMVVADPAQERMNFLTVFVADPGQVRG
jgi:hypothetical protein